MLPFIAAMFDRTLPLARCLSICLERASRGAVTIQYHVLLRCFVLVTHKLIYSHNNADVSSVHVTFFDVDAYAYRQSRRAAGQPRRHEERQIRCAVQNVSNEISKYNDYEIVECNRAR